MEQDRPDEVSSKAKALIEEYMSYEKITHDSYGLRRLRKAKQEIAQMITSLGTEGFSIFANELEEIEKVKPCLAVSA